MKLHRIALAAALSLAACAPALSLASTREPAPEPSVPANPGTAATSRVFIVQLAGAPLASYDGSQPGLAATRPAAGSRLSTNSINARAYLNFLDQRRAAVLSRVRGVRPLHTYGVTFNGFAAELNPAQISQLLATNEVVSVVPSEVRQLDTVYTADFLGLTQAGGLHTQLDAASRAVKGENVIVGVLDSGIWPESPAFSDKVGANGRPVPYNQPGTQVYGPPPAHWNGTCATGEGFTTAMCNNKLIGARFFVADFAASGAIRTPLEYLSPREGATSGHGTHTASTAAGNADVAITAASGVVTNLMTGIAPRARVAAYKVCWTATVATQTGCYTSDMLAAIDAAVADGVDVINFSISGTQLFFNDPIEMAFLNASAAGVFVAASAGNSGPGNEVAHMSPWLATVGASTHDRSQGGRLTLGNGAVVTGASTNFFSPITSTMVLSTSVAAAGQATPATTCAANSLDPLLASGRIVVCDISTNTAAARLAASAEVLRAGGIGAVLTNTASATIGNDAHTLPAIHLSNATAPRCVTTSRPRCGGHRHGGAVHQHPGHRGPRHGGLFVARAEQGRREHPEAGHHGARQCHRGVEPAHAHRRPARRRGGGHPGAGLEQRFAVGHVHVQPARGGCGSAAQAALPDLVASGHQVGADDDEHRRQAVQRRHRHQPLGLRLPATWRPTERPFPAWCTTRAWPITAASCAACSWHRRPAWVAAARWGPSSPGT